LRHLEEYLRQGPCVRLVAPPSLEALAVARLAQGLAKGERPLVCLAAEDAQAEALWRDIAFFLGGEAGGEVGLGSRVMLLPSVQASPYADLSPDRGTVMRRLSVLFMLSQGFAGDVLVMSAAAFARRVIPRDGFGSFCDVVLSGETIDRDGFAALLARSGYSRVPVVEDPGTFAVRGGVIDVFVPLYKFPARIELWGDLVETIRFFDPETQRTMRDTPELYIHPVRETILTQGANPRQRLLAAADAAQHPSSRTQLVIEQVEQGVDFFGSEGLVPAYHARMAPLTEYLPEKALFVVSDPEAVLGEIRRETVRATEGCEHARREHRLAFPAEDFLLSEKEAEGILAAARRVEVRRVSFYSAAETVPEVCLEAETHTALMAEMRRARAERGEEILNPLAVALREHEAEGYRRVLVATSKGHAERLAALLRGHGFESVLRSESSNLDLLEPGAGGKVEICVGRLGQGFKLVWDRLFLLTEEEIFGPRAARPVAKRRTVPSLGDLRNLEVGDYVVHEEHGIGRYRGLVKLPIRGTPVDFLHIEYDGGTLYLPVYRLGVLQRYAGAEGGEPRLDKLGGQTWQRARSKASAEVRKLAEELLALYAQRQALPGHAFPPADAMFREFEATFPFEETEDQQRAIDEVLADMESPKPMDRLVCGDVGYGKTEVALRAALKAVQGGKQVAVLAPTTVLVEQHFVTFSERFRDYPVRVAALSRFKQRSEQVEVIRRLAEGSVDIVIGTHRLLSPDVRFKDLGLLIIDEEQRFGVAHKERLKQLRTQIDVLTLTATPIPRTLHLAMVGLREISIIATPPADRLAVRTILCRYDPNIVRDAIRREMQRGGQAFFVHNRVQDIEEWAEKIRTLVPESRIAVAHGQMDERRLERVMVDFVDHKYDVLVCTTIIENGLDIARANTMFVNDADRFGLAQLYQLRGRIGRSRERAVCYLMVAAQDALTADAKARLGVLQRFTELGAGFSIATHDLEIRGAGELLGTKQSGVIAAVGFETYTRLLEEAVAELRGESLRRERDPDLTTDIPAYIPEEYCPDVGQRLDLYRRFATAQDEEAVGDLLKEVADRFGPPPPEVGMLADISVCMCLARHLHATSLEISETKVALAFAESTPLDRAKVARLVSGKKSLYKITPEGRLVRTLTDEERASRLEAARRVLRELTLCAN